MRRDAGFTLLEVLVALTVLGFLMLGLTQGVRFGLLAWDRQSRVTTARMELDALDRVLRRLIEQMDPGTRRDPPVVVGTAGIVEFRTNLGPAAGPLGVRDADVRLTVEGGRLVMRWRPHLRATRFAAPPPPSEAELLRGVAGLRSPIGARPGGSRAGRDAACPRCCACACASLRAMAGGGRTSSRPR
jgi:general secretion pathway protein J